MLTAIDDLPASLLREFALWYETKHMSDRYAMFDFTKHLELLESWLHGYKLDELYDDAGRLKPELRALAPTGFRRMSANPVTNGGFHSRDLNTPDFREYGIAVEKPGTIEVENARPLGVFLRDIMKNNMSTFRVFGPDETTSNKLDAIYEVSKKIWLAESFPEDADRGELAANGRAMEMLSEHTLEGWLEGYILTGRHGFLATYEAFVHVIDSMVGQHAKWLEKCNGLEWRRKIPSLNLLIT